AFPYILRSRGRSRTPCPEAIVSISVMSSMIVNHIRGDPRRPPPRGCGSGLSIRREPWSSEGGPRCRPPPTRDSVHRCSGPHLPARQVLGLLGGEAIDRDPHGLELEGGDEFVDFLGDLVHLVLQLTLVLHRPLGGQGLGGEAHVHDAGGVTVRGGQV